MTEKPYTHPVWVARAKQQGTRAARKGVDPELVLTDTILRSINWPHDRKCDIINQLDIVEAWMQAHKDETNRIRGIRQYNIISSRKPESEW